MKEIMVKNVPMTVFLGRLENWSKMKVKEVAITRQIIAIVSYKTGRKGQLIHFPVRRSFYHC